MHFPSEGAAQHNSEYLCALPKQVVLYELGLRSKKGDQE